MSLPIDPSQSGARSATPLTVVSIAYPLVAVSRDTVGGSEQVLALIDEAVVERGHRSIVIAAQGSRVAGELVATPSIRGPGDEATWASAYRVHHETLERVIPDVRPPLVHIHRVDSHTPLPTPAPALAIPL